MKQKIFNVFVSLSNIIVIILIFFYGMIFTGLEVSILELTRIPIINKNNLLAHLITILNCVMAGLNLICIIQNIKNKKLFSWYIIFLVYWSISSIAFFYKENEFLIKNLKYIICILYFVLVIINFVIEIKNKIKIWKIILYLVLTIGGVVVIFSSLYLIFILGFIMQLINNKSVKKDKIINKIINIILFFAVTMIILYTSVNLISLRIEWKKVNDETVEWIEKIQNVILNEEVEKDGTLIPVKKNGKFGYINRNGEEIIKCEYDRIPNDINMFSQYFYPRPICFIAKKGDTYYTLTTKGKVINISKENMAPFFKGSFVEKVFKETHVYYEEPDGTIKQGNVYNESNELFLATMYINVAIKSLSDTTESDNIENESLNNIEDNSLKDKILDIFNNMDNEKIIAESYYKQNDNRIYEFKLEDGKLLKVEEIIIDKNEENNIYELDFNVSVWDKDNLINEYKGIQIPWKMYDDSSRREIDSFENGYIPYCDLENKITGVFYKNNFEKAFEISGNFQIIEVIDDNRILLKDYNDLNNIKKIIIDRQGNILLSCKEVEITEKRIYSKK